jgi:hypothetical protein
MHQRFRQYQEKFAPVYRYNPEERGKYSTRINLDQKDSD